MPCWLRKQRTSPIPHTSTRLRAQLRESYERYRRTYGPINRYTTHRTGRSDPDTGEPIVRRSYPRTVRLLMRDPSGPLVLSLEIFDEETQTRHARRPSPPRASCASRRPVTRHDPRGRPGRLLDQHGRVDLETIAPLCST